MEPVTNLPLNAPFKLRTGAIFGSIALLTVFSGCTDDQARLSAVVDPLYDQIESKDSEIKNLRDAESTMNQSMTSLKDELLTVRNELKAAQEENSELKKKASDEDPDALAKKLAPIIEPLVTQAIEKALSNVSVASSNPVSPPPGSGGVRPQPPGTVVPPPPSGNTPATPAVRPAAPGSTRRTVNFGDKPQR